MKSVLKQHSSTMIFLNAGHAHLTDFNVAAYVNNEGTTENLLRNLAGTKPYMAPEIYKVCTDGIIILQEFRS